MAPRKSNAMLALLFVLGLATLWTAVAASPDTSAVRTYSAYEVDHDGDELVLADAATGEDRRSETTNVDDRIACLPSATRDCSLASQEYDGEINATGIRSAFQYAYLDGDFYRIEPNWSARHEFEYERTDPETTFASLAAGGGGPLTDVGRETIESGTTTTTGAAAYVDRIVEYENRYYTIQQTGFSSTNRAQLSDWIVPFVVGALGALGVVTGGIGLAGGLRSALRDG